MVAVQPTTYLAQIPMVAATRWVGRDTALRFSSALRGRCLARNPELLGGSGVQSAGSGRLRRVSAAMIDWLINHAEVIVLDVDIAGRARVTDHSMASTRARHEWCHVERPKPGCEAFILFRVEPTRGLEPRTYRLQDSPSTTTTASTSDFNVYSDLFRSHSGSGGHQFVSQVVSRRHTNAVIYG